MELVSIWCCKAKSWSILAGLGSIFCRFGHDLALFLNESKVVLATSCWIKEMYLLLRYQAACKLGGMRGAFESAASQRESRACQIRQQSLQLHLLWPVQDFQPEFLDPISFSLPQGSAHSAGPAPKGRQTIAFSHFWSIFTPSKKWLDFYLQKIGQKVQKSWIWGSPNPPKTDPKSFLNRGRQKVMIFH